jgi:hypothetical protein
LLHAGRLRFTTGETHVERTLERTGRLGGFDYDQIIDLALEAERGKVRGACAQQSPVDLVVLPSDWQKL